MGDSIDNIKGVPGIGEKGARELIADHGSLDALLDNAPSLTQKKYREAAGQRCRRGARKPRRCCRFARTCRCRRSRMSCFEYRGLTARSASSCFRRSASDRSSPSSRPPRTRSTATTRGRVRPQTWPQSSTSELERAGRFALSVIGDCPGGMRASLVGISFSTGARRADTCRWAHGARRAVGSLEQGGRSSRSKPLLENPAIGKIGHDLKFDLMMLAHEGIALSGLEFDTMLAELRAGCHAVEPHDRGNRARAPGLQGADRRRTSAAPARRRLRCPSCRRRRC